MPKIVPKPPGDLVGRDEDWQSDSSTASPGLAEGAITHRPNDRFEKCLAGFGAGCLAGAEAGSGGPTMATTRWLPLGGIGGGVVALRPETGVRVSNCGSPNSMVSIVELVRPTSTSFGLDGNPFSSMMKGWMKMSNSSRRFHQFGAPDNVFEHRDVADHRNPGPIIVGALGDQATKDNCLGIGHGDGGNQLLRIQSRNTVARDDLLTDNRIIDLSNA